MSNHFRKLFKRSELKPDVVRLKEFQDLHREMTAVMEHVAAAEKGYREVTEALAAMTDAINGRGVTS